MVAKKTTVKKPDAVVKAEALVAALHAALLDAQAAVQRLSQEHVAARASLKAVVAEADLALPRCGMVLVSGLAGKARGAAVPMVILRRTPTGMLVVRRAGEPFSAELKFKWNKNTERFRPAEATGYLRDARELRDVPVEYMPAGSSAA